MTDFRLGEYRTFFQRTIPNYMVNEVDPLVRGLPRAKHQEKTLVAFDVGANRGMWTRALLEHSGPLLRAVHMFEPMRGNLALIRKAMADSVYAPYDRLLSVNDIAVGKQEGVLTLHYDSDSTYYASAAVDATLIGETTIKLDKSVDVPVITLDGYCESRNIPEINLLKIDVEGWELDVLEGSQGLLRQKAIDSVIFEFGTHQMGRKEYFRDFWEFFSDLSYTMHKVQTLGRPPLTIPKYSVAYENFSGIGMFMATARQGVDQ